MSEALEEQVRRLVEQYGYEAVARAVNWHRKDVSLLCELLAPMEGCPPPMCSTQGCENIATHNEEPEAPACGLHHWARFGVVEGSSSPLPENLEP